MIENSTLSKRLCLVGHNISYSLSPSLFLHPIVQKVLPCTYELIDLSAEQWPVFWHEEGKHYDGFNITTPWKFHATSLTSHLSAEVKISGAANCLYRKNGALHAANTDYMVFKDWWYELPAVPNKVIILGNGGASKTLTSFLRTLIPVPPIIIYTREQITDLKNVVFSADDLVVNATPLGQRLPFPNFLKPLFDHSMLWDLNYNCPYNIQGQHAKGGLEFLIRQALYALSEFGAKTELKWNYEGKHLMQDLRRNAL